MATILIIFLRINSIKCNLTGTVGWPGTTFAKCCVGADLINARGVYSGIYGSSMTSLIVTSVASSLSDVTVVSKALHLFAAPCIYRQAKQSGQQGNLCDTHN